MRNYLIRTFAFVFALLSAGTPALAQQYNTLPPNSIVANVTGRSAPGNALAISDFIALLNLTPAAPAYTLRGNPTALSAVPTDFASTAGIMGWLATPSSANLRAALTDETGTGAAVFANSPTLVTPNLGTPSVLNLANASGLPLGSISGLGAGVATWAATPSSANLRSALTDETGTGAAYFQGGDIGTPSAGIATNLTALNASNLGSGTVPAARFPAFTGDCTTSAGAVATTCTKINGVDQTTSWSTYTPTVTSSGGTLTSASGTGRYKQIGKTVHLEIVATVTTVGSGTGQLKATLPLNSAAFSYAGMAKESSLTGKSGAAQIIGGTDATVVQSIDSTATTFLASGAVVNVGITYELP